MDVNADLHIHSLFSMAVSPAMQPLAIISACRKKGIHVIGSGDALHPEWRIRWQKALPDIEDITVVPTTEVEAESRVHHLIIMQDFESCAELAELLEPFGKNVKTTGRPQVALSGGKIARMVHELDGIIGPAHAFTPWTSLFKSFDSLRECYNYELPDFLELGLSADSSYGTGNSELDRIPFLSNSDAHSPSPLKIGREFNRLDISDNTPRGIISAIQEDRIVFNAGFFPEEGKYNRTACIACYQQFGLEEAESNGWRCPYCNKRIKLGVRERAEQLKDSEPSERPPYIHVIPLGEIIQKIVGSSSPSTAGCMKRYERLIEDLGDEISILIDIPVERIAETDPLVAEAIGKFRNNNIVLHPGGGGRYGTFEITGMTNNIAK